MGFYMIKCKNYQEKLQIWNLQFFYEKNYIIGLEILNLKNLARIDFLYDNSANKLYFNEVNTMPGFTNISMFPSLFNYDNLNIKELISILIEN